MLSDNSFIRTNELPTVQFKIDANFTALSFVDIIEATQNKGLLSSKVIGYSIADKKSLREVSGEQVGIP